jgi:hypothetical protein
MLITIPKTKNWITMKDTTGATLSAEARDDHSDDDDQGEKGGKDCEGPGAAAGIFELDLTR